MRRRPRPRRARGGREAPRLRRFAPASALLALLAAAAAIWSFIGPGPPARQGPSTDVVLAQGRGVGGIGSDLARARVIRSGSLFVLAAELTGAARELKAGEYQFASRATLAQVLRAIRDGAVVRHFVTIPEGLTSQAAAEILARTPYLTGPAVPAPEGALLPETYEVRRGETRASVTGRMMAARDALLATLWRRRSPNLPYRTPEQAVTMASVVEKETAKPAERPRIAAVFINRLNKGMRLESDPTVIYGLTGGAPLGHGLRVSELAAATPYNTYLAGGLPPTPIGNPGRAALAAALRPTPTNDVYFVADGSGGHVFAATFEEHRRNVARWRAIEQARLSQSGPSSRGVK